MSKILSVEEIHESFHTAALGYEDLLFSQLMDVEHELKSVDVNTTLSGSSIKTLFPSSKSVKTAETVAAKFKNLAHNKKEIQHLISELNSIHSIYGRSYRLIHYGQVINLLEKYNLYMAPTQFYKEHLPEKNAKIVEDFINAIHGSGYNNSCRWGGTRQSIPLCSQYVEHPNRTGTERQLYICAPISYFNTTGLTSVGKELYEDKDAPKFRYIKAEPIPDPIVLAPIYMESELGKKLRPMLIVTAWGPEAADSDVVNANHN